MSDSTKAVVDNLIKDCKGIIDYYVDNIRLPGDGRKVIRDAMYARVTRLTFSGFGPRVPFKWLGVRNVSMASRNRNIGQRQSSNSHHSGG